MEPSFHGYEFLPWIYTENNSSYHRLYTIFFPFSFHGCYFWLCVFVGFVCSFFFFSHYYIYFVRHHNEYRFEGTCVYVNEGTCCSINNGTILKVDADNITKATSYDVRTNFQFQADMPSLLYIRVYVFFFYFILCYLLLPWCSSCHIYICI